MLSTLLERSVKKIALLATKNKFIRNMIEKRQISLEFPASLFIEPTNLCNLKCNMCPQSIEGFERGHGLSQPLQNSNSVGVATLRAHSDESDIGFTPAVEKGYMDFELYKDIIAESLRFGKRTTIFFHKDGEPLLHPRLPEMIEYAVSRKAAYQTHLSTNAMLLRGKVMEDILRSGLDSIIINIDAATEETYKRIKKVPGLERVEENIKNFIETKKRLNLIRPLIRVKLIPVEENLGEIEAFKKKWRKLADEVVISREFLWPGFSRMGGISSISATSELSPPLTEGNKGEGEMRTKTPPINRYPCISLWLALTINWDGTVSICCIDFYHRGILGSLKDSSIQGIWKGEKLQKIRIAHLEGKFDIAPVCSHCQGLWLRDTLGKGSERWLRKKMENSKVL